VCMLLLYHYSIDADKRNAYHVSKTTIETRHGIPQSISRIYATLSDETVSRLNRPSIRILTFPERWDRTKMLVVNESQIAHALRLS
jgi:hypothetical protein